MRVKSIAVVVLTGILLAVLSYLVQELALQAEFPNGHIPYGHFKSSRSAQAQRYRVITVPTVAVTAAHVAYAATCMAWFYRRRQFGWIAVVVPWTLALYAPFAIYNFVLSAQGDASLFM